jgi:predicted dehydrogenase
MANTGVSTESHAAPPAVAASARNLRVAMIGCGGICDNHFRAFAGFSDVEVVAAVDKSPARLDAIRQKYGIARLYTDWKTMLAEVQPEAVDICTPNATHAPASIDASNAGCHVMTEKPMAMTPDECRRMIDAAARANKKLVIGFQYRFHPNTQFIKRAADEGRFGAIMFMKCRALRRRGIPNWGVFGQKRLQGGGPMIDIGVHVIEMAHYVMGSPRPVAASGNTWTYMGNKQSNVASMWPNWDWQTYDVEDLAIGQIRFDNGAIMQIEASFAAHIEKDVWNFTLVGEKGGANWDPPGIFADQAGTMVNSTPAFLPNGEFDQLFTIKLRHFVDAILYDKPMEAPGEDGLAVQKILDGVYRSAAAGKEVTID